jgi:hypothetical protein
VSINRKVFAADEQRLGLLDGGDGSLGRVV